MPGLLAATAGWQDWRTRRIPNWLTVPGLVLGILLNSISGGWSGTKNSLFGAGLGLGLLLPFVLIRSLGAGDWKLVGAVGSFVGRDGLIVVLMMTIMVAGVMALILVIWKHRFRQTMRNILRTLLGFFTFHLPGPELTLDNPEALKIPFGVAVAIAVFLYLAARARGMA